jgi:hypothetical protein
MKVSELIERLRTLPPDSPILTEGYESGWDDIDHLREANIARPHKVHRWDGEYCEADDPKTLGTPAVLIVGRREAWRE